MMDKPFLQENMMGPNAVRILEEFSRQLPLAAGMRVLDLGCGRGLTSIYLARRFGVQVFATDLWIPAAENHKRFLDQGLDGKIIPIHADAAQLPFAEGYFDAVISIDSYHYFGVDEAFLEDKILPLLRPGGFAAIAVPGLQRELAGIPEALAPYWVEDMNFHSAGWWKDLWSRSKKARVTFSGSMRCHAQAWEDWLACSHLNSYAQRDIAMMEAEGGRYFDTIGVVAKLKA